MKLKLGKLTTVTYWLLALPFLLSSSGWLPSSSFPSGFFCFGSLWQRGGQDQPWGRARGLLEPPADQIIWTRSALSSPTACSSSSGQKWFKRSHTAVEPVSHLFPLVVVPVIVLIWRGFLCNRACCNIQPVLTPSKMTLVLLSLWGVGEIIIETWRGCFSLKILIVHWIITHFFTFSWQRSKSTFKLYYITPLYINRYLTESENSEPISMRPMDMFPRFTVGSVLG